MRFCCPCSWSIHPFIHLSIRPSDLPFLPFSHLGGIGSPGSIGLNLKDCYCSAAYVHSRALSFPKVPFSFVDACTSFFCQRYVSEPPLLLSTRSAHLGVVVSTRLSPSASAYFPSLACIRSDFFFFFLSLPAVTLSLFYCARPRRPVSRRLRRSWGWCSLDRRSSRRRLLRSRRRRVGLRREQRRCHLFAAAL